MISKLEKEIHDNVSHLTAAKHAAYEWLRQQDVDDAKRRERRKEKERQEKEREENRRNKWPFLFAKIKAFFRLNKKRSQNENSQ